MGLSNAELLSDTSDLMVGDADETGNSKQQQKLAGYAASGCCCSALILVPCKSCMANDLSIACRALHHCPGSDGGDLRSLSTCSSGRSSQHKADRSAHLTK